MVTLQVLPYAQVAHLTSVGRIRKLLNIVKEGKIVVLQGRLQRAEEEELIKTTMEEINKDFKGIELAVIDQNDADSGTFGKIKMGIANALLGNRTGITLIGPAQLVKSIKRDPTKIELLTKNSKTRRD